MPIWYCAACRASYCEECWGYAPVHMKTDRGNGEAPHEKLDHAKYLQCQRLQKVLRLPDTEAEIDKLHEDDAQTTWFGTSLKTQHFLV